MVHVSIDLNLQIKFRFYYNLILPQDAQNKPPYLTCFDVPVTTFQLLEDHISSDQEDILWYTAPTE